MPAQREYLEDPGIFPLRFTVDACTEADFSNRTVIFTTGPTNFPNPDGRPIPFRAQETEARYVRLTVHAGHHNKGWKDLFGLSEILVTSGNDVVSFGAQVTTTGALDSGNTWHAAALTDGRMPHGIWQCGVQSPERGDAVIIDQGSPVISWTLDLGNSKRVDRLVLFPYQLTSSFESAVLPDRLVIESQRANGATWETITTWSNQPSSSSHLTPLVLPLRGHETRRLRITATRPWELGDLRIQGLSEIEVWSDGTNIAGDLPVFRTRDRVQERVESLTNGFASEHMIADVAVWLDQLHERLRIENELAAMRPRLHAMAAESELNVTWGSAILISFTFLIPVFLLEHRRVKANRRLDYLRKRIASDLHDDIGSNLGSISLIARTARKDLHKVPSPPPDLERDLDEVESIARESSLAMRDIVWLLERNEDSVGDLLQRMRETSTRLLRDVDYSIECHSSRSAAKLSLDAKRHLFLFFKEAVHNIRKHAGASKVSIRLEDIGDLLALEISDNGIGIPETAKDQPTTARKLKERAEVLGAQLNIESAPNLGTRIRLAIKPGLLNNTNPATS